MAYLIKIGYCLKQIWPRIDVMRGHWIYAVYGLLLSAGVTSVELVEDVESNVAL